MEPLLDVVAGGSEAHPPGVQLSQLDAVESREVGLPLLRVCAAIDADMDRARQGWSTQACAPALKKPCLLGAYNGEARWQDA